MAGKYWCREKIYVGSRRQECRYAADEASGLCRWHRAAVKVEVGRQNWLSYGINPDDCSGSIRYGTGGMPDRDLWDAEEDDYGEESVP